MRGLSGSSVSLVDVASFEHLNSGAFALKLNEFDALEVEVSIVKASAWIFQVNVSDELESEASQTVCGQVKSKVLLELRLFGTKGGEFGESWSVLSVTHCLAVYPCMTAPGEQ